MTGEKGSEENPFVNRRKKLVEDARRIREELEAEEAAEKARAKAENEQELVEARKALINDIQTTLAELPPLQMETAGSTVVTSEAFAWFYDESKPLTVEDWVLRIEDQTFTRHDLQSIFNEVRAMLREADFGLSTEDGIEFTVSWEALE